MAVAMAGQIRAVRSACSIDETVIVAGVTASVCWRRSSRARRVALRVDPQAGTIVITLPVRGSRRVGLALLRTHEEWVAQRLSNLPAPIVIAAGNSIPVCGESHLIEYDPAHRGRATIRDRRIRVSGQPEFHARRVRDALHILATERFTHLASMKAEQISQRPRQVKVKDTRSRWGSCTANGVLMFSWRLIMAPEFVQDYVIAHEVAHLRYMNHALPFWKLTEELTIYREEATNWLTSNGASLLRTA